MNEAHDQYMAADASIFESIPRRADILGGSNTGNTALATRLEMNLPGSLADAPPTLAFDRVREVDLPWAALIEAMGRHKDGAMTGTAPLRSYFERSWWSEDRPKPAAEDLQKLVDDGLITILPGSGDNAATFFSYGEVTEDDKTVPKGEPVTAGIVLRHGVSGRHYLIETTEEDGKAGDVATPEGYADFWENRAEAATMVFASEADVADSQTRFEELDLRAIFIERRFRELKIMQEVVTAASAKAAGALDGILEQGAGPDLNFEAMDAVQARYVSIRLGPYRIRRSLLQLKRQAAQMGYLLFLGDEPDMRVTTPATDGEPAVYGMSVKFPDGEDKDVLAGELYTTFRRQCAYTVTHEKSIVRNIGESIVYGFKRLFGGKTEKRTTTYSETRSKIVKDYRKVDTATDPLSKRALEYRAQGREVFVFNETPAGYLTDDGMSLANVMTRCDLDEDYRRKCVVMLPVYEQGFSIERPVVAYNIFERPLPGILPSRLPRLFIEEALSYRTAWKGTELGELVNAINLAPGEEREISITQSFQEERASSETRTSVSELNSSSNTDMATEMETIARTENEFSAHAEGSQEASAGGPLGGAITGSVSSKFSYGASDTLKSFNQSMNKVAKKAATSISKKARLDVSTTSSTTTTVSTSDSTVIRMSNINKGRTLNLMFYRVYNRYATGLFVENIGFGVTSGVELIAGSGVYETRTFRPDRIGEMLDMFKRTPLPFNNAPSAMAQYQSTILDTVLRQLETEYLAAPAQDGAGEEDAAARGDGDTAPLTALKAPETLGGSSNVVKMASHLAETIFGPARAAPAAKKGLMSAAPVDQAALDKRIAQVEPGLQEIELASAPLGGDTGKGSDLLIASGGLYLDALVGSRPSTEPYSEEMRAQEVRKSAAEVVRSEAEAQYSLAQARRIARMPASGNPAGNLLTGVHVLEEPGLNLLTLGFLLPLPSGQWVVCVDGEPVTDGEIPQDQLQRTSVVLKLSRRPPHRKPDWAKAPDLMRRVTVRNMQTQDEIAPV